MRTKFFLNYLIAEVLVVPAVTLIFKFIAERQVAALFAGILFVLLPLVIMVIEYRRAGLEQFYWFVAVLQFWTLFALPIFALRILNWGVPFQELSFLGIHGTALHQWSSKSYMVMVLFTLGVYLKSRIKK